MGGKAPATSAPALRLVRTCAVSGRYGVPTWKPTRDRNLLESALQASPERGIRFAGASTSVRLDRQSCRRSGGSDCSGPVWLAWGSAHPRVRGYGSLGEMGNGRGQVDLRRVIGVNHARQSQEHPLNPDQPMALHDSSTSRSSTFSAARTASSLRKLSWHV